MTFLKVDQIGRRFGGLIALQDVTFEVTPRQIKGVIGPNGAGKTTLFNIISGMQKPDTGRIFFTHRISKWSSFCLASPNGRLIGTR